MRNKIISVLLVAILSAICNSVNAKNASDANIGGHVVDKETGEHLPGCLITILNSGYVSMTDASGHYIFRDLTPGEYELQVIFHGLHDSKK